jgi:tRNA A37 N6-isopentenylltransferase MiaA
MAEGLMTQEDLGAMLRRLEETRALAERGLEMLRRKKDRVARLEQDKESLLESYAKMAPEALEALTSEERHRLSRMLRLRVL